MLPSRDSILAGELHLAEEPGGGEPLAGGFLQALGLRKERLDPHCLDDEKPNDHYAFLM